MKGANSKFLKTSYEENNEICNYQIDKNNSDLSDERTNPNTAKSRNAATPKSEGRKRSNSKSKTKKNLTESSIKNSNLIELVESLKEKINVYDNELRNLIEEKIQMQIQINTLQLNSYQNMKKSGNKIIKTGDHLTLSNDSNYNDEKNTGLRNELNNLNNNLVKQRKLLDQDFSILNNTIDGDSIFKKYNKNAYQIERANDFQIIKVAKFNQRISLQNFSINGTNSKSKEEIVKLEQQREIMLDEIHKLKNELMSLMQTQMQTNQIDISSKEKMKNSENYIQIEATNPSNSMEDDTKIPPLQNIFIHNKKLLVLDNENYVWHLKKCRKYKKFVEVNNEKYGYNSVEIFNAYFDDIHETIEDQKSPEKNINKEISKSNQHMLISENFIDDNPNTDNLIQHDDYEKNNVLKNEAIDFDISKMSDMSNFVNEMDLNLKHKKSSNKIEKNDEKCVNTSLDLSDDG